MTTLSFVVPGRLDQLTGGYRFDHRVVMDLRDQGHTVEVIELAGTFPSADAAALEACETALRSCADQRLVVVDGLALPGFANALPEQASRLRVVGFVHHPLSAETGLSPSEAQAMSQLEAQLWKTLRGVICPSEDSASRVRAAGLDDDRVAVAPPGTDPVPEAWRTRRPCARTATAHMRETASTSQFRSPPTTTDTTVQAPVALLSVGTITPRKGHHLLIEALGSLRDLPWTLTCVGSLERDRTCSDEVRRLIAHYQLEDRVHLMGELSDERLRHAYSNADIFVLPSFHEGYGMVFAEALAWGLPIIATRGGAIPQTVPAQAGLLIKPGDVFELTPALTQLITQTELRTELATASRAAGQRLATWPQAVQFWLQQVERLAA